MLDLMGLEILGNCDGSEVSMLSSTVYFLMKMIDELSDG